MKYLRAAVLVGLVNSASGTDFYVDCQNGSDSGQGSEQSPFLTLARAQQAYRAARFVNAAETVTVVVHGWCELAQPLVLDDPRDSGVSWLTGAAGAMLSAGTQLDVGSALAANASGLVQVDLTDYNFTTSTLGHLSGRGYPGGSGCILVDNYELSGAELFFRPEGSAPGIIPAPAAYGDDDSIIMRLARFPNRNPAAEPSATDWLKIHSVIDHSLQLSGDVTKRLDSWATELASDSGEVWAHGLWQWNWADSHRPVTDITTANDSVTVGDDNINRDVNLQPGSGAQGGNLYFYNLHSELDAPGEYYINRSTAVLEFLAPRASLPTPAENCWWNVTVSRSDGGPTRYVIAEGASAETFLFDGTCSADEGPMGTRCVDVEHVAAGARLLKRQSDGATVGEGVCCNGVTSSVAQTERLNCSQELSGAPPSNGTYHVSRLDNVVLVHGVSDITFGNFEFRHARGGAVVVENSSDIQFVMCTFADNGMMGLNITGGSSCGTIGSDIYGNGDAGAVLLGGNRTDLTPSAHYVRGSTVHSNQRWIMNYAPNIMLAGVGQIVSTSTVYNSPQIGLFIQGNDHLAENSTFHHLAQQCSDCGGFYAGRDWTYRGNSLERNLWHHINPSIFSTNVMTIYLDDQLSSVRIADSIFNHTGDVLQLGGGAYNKAVRDRVRRACNRCWCHVGRNNEFVGNIVNGSGGIAFDNRGGGGSGCAQTGRLPYDFLARVPYASSPAWQKYPDLANLLSDEPCLAKYNNLSNNILCGGSTSLGVSEAQAAAWGSIAENNVVGSC